MNDLLKVLTKDEKVAVELRALYEKFGYNQYKMSKFEEYDLYANNKDFLVSDNVITFTDTNGKLLALKPDVTLSIIKNSKDNTGSLEKLYYDENVYRISKGTKSFKEITQVGLECLGEIDDYAISEVLYLAVKSLENISDEYILDISSLDIVSNLLDEAGLSDRAKNQLLSMLGDKNSEGVFDICTDNGVSDEKTETIKSLVTLYGNAEKVICELLELNVGDKTKDSILRLGNIVKNLKAVGVADKINIDFSVVNDINYYNGLVFKGFISGVPTGILSGGQYDKLMMRMKKKSSAIGFAVYLDELMKFMKDEKDVDADVFILYKNAGAERILEEAIKYTEKGRSVLCGRTVPEKKKFNQTVSID